MMNDIVGKIEFNKSILDDEKAPSKVWLDFELQQENTALKQANEALIQERESYVKTARENYKRDKETIRELRAMTKALTNNKKEK